MMELPLSGETPAHVYYLNGKRVESRGHHIGGTNARMRLSPECAGYHMWKESDDGISDTYLRDGDTISIGDRIYSIPPCIGA